MNADVLVRIGELAVALIELAGAGWTVALILGILVVALVWRRQSHKKLTAGWNTALEEKERTVQRLANEARDWRTLCGFSEICRVFSLKFVAAGTDQAAS